MTTEAQDTAAEAAGPMQHFRTETPPAENADLDRGLRFAHVMMTVMQDQSNDAVAFAQALADLLMAKGIIRADEIETPLTKARAELEKVIMPRVRLADMGDKYEDNRTVVIDCASRLHLCQARCCSFRFFLTKQDLDEGIAKWDYGNPYWIRQAQDGYCCHSDPQTRGCTIHAQRPHTCRQYDCRNDTRVWVDFEKRIPAPMGELTGNPPIAMAEVAYRNSHEQEAEAQAAGGGSGAEPTPPEA